MGPLFVIIIQLIAIIVGSLVLGAIGAAIARVSSKRENQKRNVTLAARAPFVALFSFYIVATISLTVVSVIFNVDSGVGDSWYVNLSEECELAFIDDMGAGNIYCYDIGEPKVPNVVTMQQVKNMVYCKTYSGEYYLLNTRDTTVKRFDDEYAMRKAGAGRPELLPVVQFYSEKKWDRAGVPFIIAGFVSFIASIMSVLELKKRIGKAASE